MEEPQKLSNSIAELITSYPPGHRLHELGQELATVERRNAARLAAILKYDDLAKRLTEPPIGYKRIRQWNGWIPPAMNASGGDPELCRSPEGRLNQRGKYALDGPSPNDSPRRLALVELAQEAWRREHPEAGSR